LNRGGKIVGADNTGSCRHLGQGRIVVDRQCGQGEASAAARDDHPRAFDGDVDRVRRQAPADLRKKPARDEGAPRLSRIDLDPRVRRHFVVEARQREGVGDLEQQTGQYGDWRPRRQTTSGPGHSLGENVAVDPKFHAAPITQAVVVTPS